MTTYLVIIGMGLCTFLPRYLPLVIFMNRDLPASIKIGLGFVTPAVLAAIVVSGLIMPGGTLTRFTLTNPYIVAGTVTILATLATKRVLLSSFIGIGIFFILQWILN